MERTRRRRERETIIVSASFRLFFFSTFSLSVCVCVCSAAAQYHPATWEQARTHSLQAPYNVCVYVHTHTDRQRDIEGEEERCLRLVSIYISPVRECPGFWWVWRGLIRQGSDRRFIITVPARLTRPPLASWGWVGTVCDPPKKLFKFKKPVSWTARTKRKVKI